MKKLLFLLSISILFQSCYSYKSIDYNNIETEKKQKFEIKGAEGTFSEGRLVSKNEKTIVLENKGQTQTISKEEIYDIKVREFSTLKSAGLVVGLPIVTFIGLGLLFVIFGGGM
jgi:hypothetical protein